MARRRQRSKQSRTTYGKAFKKTSNRGKHRKGTWLKYKYVNGRRVGAVRSRK
jgi:hypothetical protein